MADNKSCEVIKRIKQDLKWGRITNRDLKGLIGETEFSPGRDLSVRMDFSESITRLKSIQREAKKATATLKELGEQRKGSGLLTIELENEEDTLPKVFYKGEEITNKVRVHFDWKTKTDYPGKLEVNIDYYEADDQAKPRITGIGIDRLT